MDAQPAATVTSASSPLTHQTCQQAIIDTLLAAIPTTLMPETLHIVPLFDRQNDRYQLLCSGWTQNEKRIFYPVIHIDIIHDQVWIQHSQSDFDIGAALVAQGIPHSQIILSLLPHSIPPSQSTLCHGRVSHLGLERHIADGAKSLNIHR